MKSETHLDRQGLEVVPTDVQAFPEIVENHIIAPLGGLQIEDTGDLYDLGGFAGDPTAYGDS